MSVTIASEILSDLPSSCESFVPVLSEFVSKIEDNARQIDSWTAPKSGPSNAEILTAARASTDPDVIEAVRTYDAALEAFTLARGVLGMNSSDERERNTFLAEQTKMIEDMRATITVLVNVLGVNVEWVKRFDDALPIVKASGEKRSILTETFVKTLNV